MTLYGEEKRSYQREWMARRRADWFAGRACVICGSTNRLELDHLDPSTKVSHRVWSWSEARRLEEIAKCQVLCEFHHLEKTVRETSNKEHGKRNTYMKHGCRCAECVEAARIHRQAYRNKNMPD